MAKPKLDYRMNALKDQFGMYTAGHLSEDVVKINVKFAGMFLTEAELEKFWKKHPDINQEDFKGFLEIVGATKAAAQKSAGGVKIGTTTINTPDKGVEVGVTAENIPKYIELTTQLIAVKKELQKIVPNGIVSLAIPIKKEKKKKAETATVPV